MHTQPLISLCVIVGNVAEYIERFIISFAPLADEIILVRAIGSAQPDDTFAIAERLCSELGKKLTLAEYINSAGHEDWPHLDSFAAARQMSFDLAAGDYCFWADTDDVLTHGSAELIREHAARGGHPVFIFPYEIFGRGVTVPRERMILREAPGSWLYPVHECYRFSVEVQGVSDERVVVQHMPKPSKSGSTERNLRILESIPDSELSAGLLYHLHCEQLSAGKTVVAIDSAKRALSHHDIGKPEAYELFLNLARMSGHDPGIAKQYLLQAYATDPARREALGMLSTTAIDAGDGTAALAHARQMLATERPSDWSWNDRSAAYTWLGKEIYQQALRAAGRQDEAEVVRIGILSEADVPIISLIHATRGRAQKASMARKLWMDLAERPECIEHIFAFDSDDDASRPLRRFNHVVTPAGGGCVAAWNAGASRTIGSILIQLSDDWMPPAKWDTLIRERTGDVLKSKVLAVSDGTRADNLLCMAIITRARYLSQSVFLPDFVGPVMFDPRFTGVYSDNWFTHCAYRDGVVIDARDLVFEHQHPAFHESIKPDETYIRQNAPERYAEGKVVYEQLLSEESPDHFDWRSIPGWFDFAEFYSQISALIPVGGIVIEVGCWMGQSITYLAQCLRARGWKGELAAVDTFKGEPNQPAHVEIVAGHGGSIRSAFEENVRRAGFAETIKVIESDSAQAASLYADDSCDFVFLDAAHDYESVKSDIQAWWGKVKKDGILAGHDYPYHEVNRAVHEFFDAEKIDVGTIGRCWIVKKP